MASEKACQEGISCKLVVVADDCALERTKGITGARGVAGTVLVHKIAGAAARAGKTLDEIINIVSQVSSRMGTLGVALDSVTIPGADVVNDRLDDATIEIGMGIHGEAGMRRVPLLTANEIAKEIVQTIQKHGRLVTEDGVEKVVPNFEKGDELCVLVNNLGGTSNFEMSILANAAVSELEGACGARVTRLLVGSYMTAFECHGASITILNLSGAPDDLVTFLDAPCDAPAWIECDKNTNIGSRNSSVECPEIQVDEKKVEVNLPPLIIEGFEDIAKSMALNSVKTLGENEALLTKYDTIVGDGDCGITMKRGATEVEERLNQGTIDTSHPVLMFATLADAVSSSMGGTSGVLLELCFRKMSSTLSQCENIGYADLSNAFQAGVDAISLYGGASIGARTMLDALIPAAASLVQTNDLKAAAAEAKAGADGTAKMKLASAGRSNYLSEETLEGTPDPGAVAVAIVFGAIC
jgi:dihydroxyacetone kinase